MCGIFACIGGSNAALSVFNSLRELEYRGYDSWGVAAIKSGEVDIYKDIGFLPAKPPTFPRTSLALGHTRWATHGGITVANAHPHCSCQRRFVVVHNGIFENHMAIKQQLSPTHQFVSETDTEVIAHFVEEKYAESNNIEDAVRLVATHLSGLNAFVLADTVTKRVFVYRHGSPLILGKKGETFFVSSDLPTLASHVEYIYPLRDGDLLEVTSNNNQLAWVKQSIRKRQSLTIKTRYHMESELVESVKLMERGHHFNPAQLALLKKAITNAADILLIGCGSAYHACLYGEQLLTNAGKRARAVVASNHAPYSHLITPKTLVLAVSQSGETIDTLELLNFAKTKGATIASLTNVPYSTVDRTSSLSLHLNVGVEQAVASTKAYLWMNLAFYALTHRWDIGDLVKQSVRLFQPKLRAYARQLAKKILPLDHLYLIGTGEYYPVSLEAALKFKEIGYLHAEAILTGELKHGPLALIGPGAVCLVLGDSDKTAIVVEQIKARGGSALTLNSPSLGVLSPIYLATLLLTISFELSLLRGINPDRPRNLAKSVTVR